jgi:hypothetical protein
MQTHLEETKYNVKTAEETIKDGISCPNPLQNRTRHQACLYTLFYFLQKNDIKVM